MNKPSHSPLPWFSLDDPKLRKEGLGCLQIMSRNQTIAIMEDRDVPLIENTSFIIRAVNSFYPMLEALKNAQKSLDPFDTDDETLLMIQEAIKLAENED